MMTTLSLPQSFNELKQNIDHQIDGLTKPNIQ